VYLKKRSADKNVNKSNIQNPAFFFLTIMGFVKNDKSVPCRFLGLESV
jgi:hypothetical protein